MQYGRTVQNYNFGYPGHSYSYGVYSQPGGYGPLFPNTYSTGYSQNYGPLYGQPQMFSGYNGGLGGGYSQGQLDAYYGYGNALSQYTNQYAGSTNYGGSGSWNNSVFDYE